MSGAGAYQVSHYEYDDCTSGDETRLDDADSPEECAALCLAFNANCTYITMDFGGTGACYYETSCSEWKYESYIITADTTVSHHEYGDCISGDEQHLGNAINSPEECMALCLAFRANCTYFMMDFGGTGRCFYESSCSEWQYESFIITADTTAPPATTAAATTGGILFYFVCF